MYLYRKVLILLSLLTSIAICLDSYSIGDPGFHHKNLESTNNNYISSNREFLELGPTPNYYGSSNSIGIGRGIVIYADQDFDINSFGIYGELFSEEFVVLIYSCPNGNSFGNLLFSYSDLSGGSGLAWNDIYFNQNFTFNEGEYYWLNWEPIDGGFGDWTYDHGLDFYHDDVLPINFGPLTLIDGTSTQSDGSPYFENILHAFFRINVVNSESGCTDPYACNYDPDATEDDGSCAYEEDCAGECGGDAEEDECGVCGGDGSTCDDSNTMNVITGIIYSDYEDYQEILSAGFYVFNDPITEDLNMSLNGVMLSKQRTYHNNGPMGGYTFETDEFELEYADSAHLNISGDFNFDYTVLMPTNMMITSHNDGDEIDPSDNMMITYTADNYDFFHFSYGIDYTNGTYQDYSGFTYDTSFTIQSELLDNAVWIHINVDALSGMHPIDEVLVYSENTMASIFGLNGAGISLGNYYREESLPDTHNSIMDLWKSGEFSRLYSQFITESEDNSFNQSRDIMSDDILIYSVMHYNEDYYNGNIIVPFIIISSPTYFEDTEIFVNGLEIETFYAFPFGIATTFGDNESEEYPTPQEINTYEIYINGEVISGEFSFSDSTEFTNWVSGQNYNGAEDLYIEWADNEADFYSIKVNTWSGTDYEACNLDTSFITESTNFTIPNTFFSGCYGNDSEIDVQVASVNGVVPIVGAIGDIENSYGFSSWAWNEEIYLYIPIDTECPLGDLNGDCELNILDVVTLVDIIMSNGNYIAAGDINGDGYLNIMDIVQLVILILEF